MEVGKIGSSSVCGEKWMPFWGAVQKTQFLLLGDSSDSVEWFQFVTICMVTQLHFYRYKEIISHFLFQLKLKHYNFHKSSHLFAENVALDSEQQFTHFTVEKTLGRLGHVTTS